MHIQTYLGNFTAILLSVVPYTQRFATQQRLAGHVTSPLTFEFRIPA